MKLHYFSQDKPDDDDILLKMAIGQGYVPATCLLGGQTVMAQVNLAESPCKGCGGPREECFGQPE